MSPERLHACPMIPYTARIDSSMSRSEETHSRIKGMSEKVNQLDRIPDIVAAINRASWSNILLTAFLAVLLVLKELKDSNTNFKASGLGTSVEVTNK